MHRIYRIFFLVDEFTLTVSGDFSTHLSKVFSRHKRRRVIFMPTTAKYMSSFFAGCISFVLLKVNVRTQK